jgi:hypothetical protein
MTVCNFETPYNHHSVPIDHRAARTPPMPEWPDDCVWWQLKSERYDAERMGHNYSNTTFLENLEMEWLRRRLCSRCQREIDQSLAERFAELESRTHNAEDKLGRIRVAVQRPDLTSPAEVRRILDEP